MTILKKTTAYYKTFEGDSYQIGVLLGKWALSKPEMLKAMLLPPNVYPQKKLQEITELLDQYCSGINEEIQGFADTVGIERGQALFYAMTYLERGCSLFAAMPAKTRDGHTILARNYEFSDVMEELCFSYTQTAGKYKHLGSMINLFGRGDGMNECGLAVAQASCGMPVGNFEGGQKAEVSGLQFWAVIRGILENCQNVKEAVNYCMEVPIGYNMNLMLADKSGEIALFECIDGHKANKLLDGQTEESFLSATNHAVLTELKSFEKVILENSMIRNDLIVHFSHAREKFTKTDIKQLLSSPYPNGLCCHYYGDFFGTLRSMIFDVTAGQVEMTFGSPQQNDWQLFTFASQKDMEFSVQLPYEQTPKNFYNIL
ncbi:C45 family autoproteolytic acyltransferase/hydolase [Paenibacillus sp. sgz500992]|uniref:C45 family autoproteolytic acyltransferase/hydolase n=1 Tax=Paenibacillus sp. sgz500992 TaxID=3242476 RepID=UPI0036D27709